MREDHEVRIGRQVGEAYRRVVAPGPEARERLLERIAEMPAPRPHTRPWARLMGGHALAPQRLALAAACVLVSVSGVALIERTLAPDSGGRTIFIGDMRVPPPNLAENPVVRFDLTAPDAGGVTLVGDFNGWDRQATPMRRAKTPGTWTVSVPLERGRHVYGFVVDGVRWVADPMAPLAPADGFGGVNSIVVVNGPGGS
jgi:hypothetical protein